MFKIYVLYSKTRNICYLNDENHEEFWSLFLRYKYPNDKWIVTDTDSIVYIDLIRNENIAKNMKTINLYDDIDLSSRKINRQIMEARNQLAINFIKSKNESIANDLFLVYKSSRGEAIVIYNGSDIDEAFKLYQSQPGCESVELWRNGRCIDMLFSKEEYYQKYKIKKSS